MSRLTYAAQQLVSQLPDAEVTLGEPDGLDVVREITVDRSTGKWLAPLLVELQDRRIVSSEMGNRGGLKIVFHSESRVADDRSPFPLEAAGVIAEQRSDEGSDETEAEAPDSSESDETPDTQITA